MTAEKPSTQHSPSMLSNDYPGDKDRKLAFERQNSDRREARASRASGGGGAGGAWNGQGPSSLTYVRALPLPALLPARSSLPGALHSHTPTNEDRKMAFQTSARGSGGGGASNGQGPSSVSFLRASPLPVHRDSSRPSSLPAPLFLPVASHSLISTPLTCDKLARGARGRGRVGRAGSFAIPVYPRTLTTLRSQIKSHPPIPPFRGSPAHHTRPLLISHPSQVSLSLPAPHPTSFAPLSRPYSFPTPPSPPDHPSLPAHLPPAHLPHWQSRVVLSL